LLYFKNTELAKIFNVSEKSVRNWIQAAQQGKLDLQLHEYNGKVWIANTAKNSAILQKHAQQGKKYKNRRGAKIVTPTQRFYELYNQKQILDIIAYSTIHHEIPTRYSYMDGGAQYWDDYAKRLGGEDIPNILNKTIELLEMATPAMNELIESGRKVNVVDLGPGNGLPIRPMLTRLIDEGRLKRYIAIDGSQDMLDILETNIKKWFGDTIHYEGYIRDISHDRFDDLFADDYAADEAEVPANLVCLLGGTLSNFKSPTQTLLTINESMGLNDLLIYTGLLDTPAIRRYFDFNNSHPNQKLRSELILAFLGIEEDLYEMELKFDDVKRARSISCIPTVDLTIKFELAHGTRYVELRKGEPILLWRHWHKDAIDIINQFDQTGYDIMNVARTVNQEYMLAISKIKVEI